jgi:hypothetical protein
VKRAVGLLELAFGFLDHWRGAWAFYRVWHGIGTTTDISLLEKFFRRSDNGATNLLLLFLFHYLNELLVSFPTLLDNFEPSVELTLSVKADPDGLSFERILLDIDVWITVISLPKHDLGSSKIDSNFLSFIISTILVGENTILNFGVSFNPDTFPFENDWTLNRQPLNLRLTQIILLHFKL